ncbi:hypothetical protein [Pseudoduganella sp. HUAS MS19]
MRMKTRAYLEQAGKVTVTAWSVANERDQFYRGESTRQTYYSLHNAGQRKPMSHVYRKGSAPHFKYKVTADEHSGGAGESLQHLLFKEALSSITGTMLKLGKLGNHRITVIASELEKGIDHPESLRRTDVFLRFESETSLGLKWGGELYVEIRRAHAVDNDKLDIARSLRLPMVEVSIPQGILYEYDVETTTDEHEAAYVCRIRKMLEGPTGFLSCDVLNNPSTLEYLEQHRVILRQQLAESEKARGAAEERVGELTTEVQRLEENACILTAMLARSEESVTAAKCETSRLRNDVARRDQELKELRKNQNDWHIDGRWAIAAFAVSAVVILGVQYLRP